MPHWPDRAPFPEDRSSNRTGGFPASGSRRRTACSRSPQGTLYIEGFDGFVASAAAPIATGWSDPFAGRVSHPLRTGAFFTAHRAHGTQYLFPLLGRAAEAVPARVVAVCPVRQGQASRNDRMGYLRYCTGLRIRVNHKDCHRSFVIGHLSNATGADGFSVEVPCAQSADGRAARAPCKQAAAWYAYGMKARP